ncbi:MAG: twin-arginine translocation signal domain-containing protein, partial [Terracidiphilus sp.]
MITSRLGQSPIGFHSVVRFSPAALLRQGRELAPAGAYTSDAGNQCNSAGPDGGDYAFGAGTTGEGGRAMSGVGWTRRGFLRTSSVVGASALLPRGVWALGQDPVVDAAGANNHAG